MTAAEIQAIIDTMRVRLANVEGDFKHLEQVIHAQPVPAPQPPPSLPPPAPATTISDRLIQLYRLPGIGPAAAMAIHQMYFWSGIPGLNSPENRGVLPFYCAIFGWDGQNPNSNEGLAKRQWVNAYENSFSGEPWWPALQAAPMTWMP